MTTIKKQRKIVDVDFSSDNAHIALCSKEQGAANNHNKALLLKSKTDLTKAQQVQVTMELPEFLRRFFDLYYEDAEILARLMGYEPPEPDNTLKEYSEWIDEKVKNITLLKSLHSAENLEKAVGSVAAEDLVSITETIQALQGSLEESNIAKTAELVKSKEKNTMAEKAKEEVQTELQKAQAMIADLQKAADEAKKEVELMKAAQAEAEKKAKEDKQTELVKAAIGEREEVALLVKSFGTLEDEEVQKIVGLVKSLKDVAEASPAMQEKGITADAKAPLTKQAKALDDVMAFIKTDKQ